MIHSATRVAPEKAVFRPALSRSFTAGLSPERDMAKDNRPYWEKLQDVRWQKLRLKALEEAGWECTGCLATDKTLNVHHRIYRKNAEPWEYGLADLAVLCVDCHKDEHSVRDRLKEVMAGMNAEQVSQLVGFAKALANGWSNEDLVVKDAEELSGAARYFGISEWEVPLDAKTGRIDVSEIVARLKV